MLSPCSDAGYEEAHSRWGVPCSVRSSVRLPGMNGVPNQIFSTFKMAAVSARFFFNDTATTEIYTLSLHDALPISPVGRILVVADDARIARHVGAVREVRRRAV